MEDTNPEGVESPESPIYYVVSWFDHKPDLSICWRMKHDSVQSAEAELEEQGTKPEERPSIWLCQNGRVLWRIK